MARLLGNTQRRVNVPWLIALAIVLALLGTMASWLWSMLGHLAG